MPRISRTIATFFLLFPALAFAADPSVAVSPQDPAVHYVGRWDAHDPANLQADWPASEVDLHFTGTGASVRLKGGKAEEVQVIVDGAPTTVLKFTADAPTQVVAAGLPDKEHTIQLVKRTEAFVGTLEFSGFVLPSTAKALPWTVKPDHRIEMIGDSITCGYGDEDTDNKHHFSPKTENAYLAYGPIAARAFNAECVVIAWSGRKMFPDNTIPAIYGQTLAKNPKIAWDFTRWIPDAVVINLSTNDFHSKATVPDEAGWIAAYKKFITSVIRKNYPDTNIFICTSPMLSGQAQANLKKYLGTIQTDLAAAGDKKIHIVNIATQDSKDGYGADWHPNLTTQSKMADTLIQTISDDLGWKPQNPTR